MKEKERKLSPAEEKRKEVFVRLCGEMEQKGYRRRDLTVSVLMANVLGLLSMLPFVAAIAVIGMAVQPNFNAEAEPYSLFLLCAGILLCTVIHEGIHGLTWGIFAEKRLRSIEFGVIWKALTPYCTCSCPLKRWQYIVGSAMPTLILGFGLAAVAIVLGNSLLFALALIMIFGGGGDFLIILKMLFYRSKGGETLFYDHPYECGLVAFERE